MVADVLEILVGFGSTALLAGYDVSLPTNQVTRPGDPLLREGAGCRKCSPETRGRGAAAVELLRMVDIRLAPGVLAFLALERGLYPSVHLVPSCVLWDRLPPCFIMSFATFSIMFLVGLFSDNPRRARDDTPRHRFALL